MVSLPICVAVVVGLVAAAYPPASQPPSQLPPVVDPPRQPGQGPETPREGFPELGLPDPPAPPDEPTDVPQANVLLNPSFESGIEPWFSFAERNPISWGPFSVSDTVGRTGSHSAFLEMDSAKYPGKTRIHGAIQEFKARHAPATIGGWYRVEGWERGTKKQYLQAVVILWIVRERRPSERAFGNVQIAYTLAGVEEPPLSISNRRFSLSGPPEPVQDEWVHFEFHPRKDFIEQWGFDFEGFEYCRVLFEVRYDDHQDTDPPSRANVYYDDLYAVEE
mgnify:CR=1 FL=1